MKVIYVEPVCDRILKAHQEAQDKRKVIEYIQLTYEEGKELCSDLRVLCNKFPAWDSECYFQLGECYFVGILIKWPTRRT